MVRKSSIKSLKGGRERFYFGGGWGGEGMLHTQRCSGPFSGSGGTEQQNGMLCQTQAVSLHQTHDTISPVT